ncbi:polysaccharide biosynthesis protein [Pirellula staleyi DSM 6068]|uniref:Polysaccharide biosynthesis protein n=1 Tax=Pirellula staleyi (strain ATCC 27377 / DSM 6068 / ICPB 4128) TaxID=530564 RepID=D2QX16_PIRSD|nr:lipopolysaccharide biosynthesis protein [Pirellula staleyi]ADB16120.1 polysaccharide biosynthesis protein [Pirellula staleyi DSM 6068]
MTTTVQPTTEPSAARGRLGALWVVGARVVGIGATLGGNILAARLLGPAEFGVYLVLSTIVAFGSILAMGGLNEAGLRLLGESLALGDGASARQVLRRVLKLGLVTSLVAAVVVSCAAAWVGPLPLVVRQSLLALVLLGVAMIALGWQQLSAELLRGLGDLRLASLFSGGQTGGPISNLLFLATTSTLLLCGASLSASELLGVMTASILATLPLALVGLLWIARRELAQVEASAKNNDTNSAAARDSAAALLSITGILLVIQILNFFNYQLDMWLAGITLSEVEVGLFGVAKRSMLLAQMPVQMAMYATMGQLPRLFAQGETRELEAVVRSSSSWAAIPSLAALALLLLFPTSILTLVFGGSFRDAAVILWPLAIGAAALVLAGNPTYVLVMMGRQREVLIVHLLATLLLAAGGYYGASTYGAVGLALAASASVTFQNGLLWWLARQQAGIWTHPGKLRFSLGKTSIPARTEVRSDTESNIAPLSRQPTH